MSDEPRNLYPGTTYAVLRDVHDGRCGLPPDVDTRQMLGFLLADTQQRVEANDLHAFRAAPNVCLYLVTHWTEPNRTPPPTMSGVPAFFREFHRMTARNQNVRSGRSGYSFWSNKKPIMIELPTEEDVWDVLVQIELLHLSAGIVPRGWRDPYLKLGPRDIGRNRSFSRPPDLVRGFMPSSPERSTVRITPPPALEHMSRDEIVRELEERCEPVRRELAAVDRSYLEPDDTAEFDVSMRRPMPAFSDDSILSRHRPPWKNHFIASHDPAAEEDRQHRRDSFRRRHRRALEQLRKHSSRDVGALHEVVFPSGTWGAWQLVWVSVEPFSHGRPPPTSIEA